MFALVIFLLITGRFPLRGAEFLLRPRSGLYEGKPKNGRHLPTCVETFHFDWVSIIFDYWGSVASF